MLFRPRNGDLWKDGCLRITPLKDCCYHARTWFCFLSRPSPDNQKRGLHVIEDGEQSDNGSSDSDTILDGNVPEPVGLPRYITHKTGRFSDAMSVFFGAVKSNLVIAKVCASYY